jgi:methyltransferase (TIGR00027 family)
MQRPANRREDRIVPLKQGRLSRTANKVAIRRAAHQLFDQPKVLDDPLAVPIIGVEAVEKLRSSPKERQHPISRAFRAFMAARSRYAEDQLAKAIEERVAQYVVLGAGLDTFAYRNPHAAYLQVFEVDHPATQAWKLERLQTAGIAIPTSLKFVPVDFERQTLAAGLAQGGFDSGSPAFFSWLGVTPYLTRESCIATLRFIAQLPPGSGVAFDFAVDPSHRTCAGTQEHGISAHRNTGYGRNQRPLFQGPRGRTTGSRWVGTAYGSMGVRPRLLCTFVNPKSL